MDQIPFDQLVAALKGKGPGDFINSATGGIMKGREMSLEERKRAFLDKVEAARSEREQKKSDFDVENQANQDMLTIGAGRVGSEIKDPTTGRVTGVVPPKYDDSRAKELIAMVQGAKDRYFGVQSPAPELPGSTGAKPPTAEDVKGSNKADAKVRVTDLLSFLQDKYNKLNDMGAIVTPTRDTGENVSARTRSSAPGQFVAGAMGTEEQVIRDQIRMSRPLLVQEIRKATDMGARGMDSEKELEFYLNAATDPTISLEANLSALAVLDAAYGLGKIRADQPKPTAPQAAPAPKSGWRKYQ